jgi:hypothetical protein
MAGIKFFSVDNVFGTQTGWTQNTGSNPNITEERANALGATGDEIAWQAHGKKEAYSATFVSTALTGNLAIPKVGTVVSGVHIDSVSVAYTAVGYPILTLNGHKHLAGEVDTGCKEYQASITLPAQFGVPSTITDAFTLEAEAEVGMRGMTYTLTCTHVEEMDADGGLLGSDNHDGVETLAIELTGEADPAEYTIDADWHEGSANRSQANTSATTKSLTLTKHISAYTAP